MNILALASGNALLLWVALILVLASMVPWAYQWYACAVALLLVILFLLGA